ncbi:hypothetical protein HYV43_03285 [Candidatus Micrarchaeota archaeon]|nr:hypothetical protein [Candidatus Micrarchaeota archaeon]
MADDHGHGGSHDAGHGGSHGHGGHAKGGSHGGVGRREPLIFMLLLGGMLLIPVALLFVFKLPLALAVSIVLVLLAAAVLAPRIQEVKEYERGVQFDFGRYKKTLTPGWYWILPLFQKVELVDMRTQTIDIPPQEVITKEDIAITIDAIAYYRIVDPKKAIVEVKDVRGPLEHVLHGEITTQIGKIPLQDVLEKLDEINQHLHHQLQLVEQDWGIHVSNVEITHVKLPSELEAAFRKKQEALEYKEKLETESRARSVALRILTEATEAMGERTMTYLYMETLKRVADGRASKIILPMELTQLAHALSAQVKAQGGQVDEEKLAASLVGAYLKTQKQAATTTKTTRVQVDAETEKPGRAPQAG